MKFELELLYISLTHCPFCQEFTRKEWPRLSSDLIEYDRVGARHWDIDKFSKDGADQLVRAHAMYEFHEVPALIAIVNGEPQSVWRDDGSQQCDAPTILAWLARVWSGANLSRLLKRPDEECPPTVIVLVRDDGPLEAWEMACAICREFKDTLIFCTRLICTADVVRVQGDLPLIMLQTGRHDFKDCPEHKYNGGKRVRPFSLHVPQSVHDATRWINKSAFLSLSSD